mmetsp:Transcript_14729/g.21457  ORF Transcript_14729/g.21457 Transcript_14729/m.21457 type:complete len:154 (+) Transcript_14729:40-501(+)
MESRDSRTFVLVKPDGVQRRLVSDVMGRFEKRGLKLCGLKFLNAPNELLKEHYAEHEGKPFYSKLVQYVGSGPVVAMCWEGSNAVDIGRRLIGSTKPSESPSGTIRGDLGLDVGRNIVHGSDSAESAKRELDLWFNQNETVSWSDSLINWLYE